MSDQTKQQEARSLPATFAKNEFEKDAFILRQLVTKDFKIKYRRSVLGVAWSVLNPLLMMIVMAIVFSTIFGQGRNGSMTPEMYPLYLIVGNVCRHVRVYEPGPDVDRGCCPSAQEG